MNCDGIVTHDRQRKPAGTRSGCLGKSSEIEPARRNAALGSFDIISRIPGGATQLVRCSREKANRTSRPSRTGLNNPYQTERNLNLPSELNNQVEAHSMIRTRKQVFRIIQFSIERLGVARDFEAAVDG